MSTAASSIPPLQMGQKIKDLAVDSRFWPLCGQIKNLVLQREGRKRQGSRHAPTVPMQAGSKGKECKYAGTFTHRIAPPSGDFGAVPSGNAGTRTRTHMDRPAAVCGGCAGLFPQGF